VAANNNRVHPLDHPVIACSRHLYMGVILYAHPVRGESHIPRNANREVATPQMHQNESNTFSKLLLLK